MWTGGIEECTEESWEEEACAKCWCSDLAYASREECRVLRHKAYDAPGFKL